MLRNSAARVEDHGYSALPYNITPAHTAQAKAILGPNNCLAVEQKICLETDPVRARALGRAELADGGNDRFIDAMVLHGNAATIKSRRRAHFDAGATHVCLQPVHAPDDFAHRDTMLAALADT